LATAFSHAVGALSIGTWFRRGGIPARVWIAGVVCSVIPDIDVIGFRFGVHYNDFWGHRGFTHSLLFAVILAGAATVIVAQRELLAISRWAVFAYLFTAGASHGLLDAMTNGGLGVAFFSPFDNARYFLPWRPIQVSPVSVGRFFGPRAEAILVSEFLWIWIPAGAIAAVGFMLNRVSARPRNS
jgi:inner membrane protein